MSSGTWRDHARVVISKVMAEHGDMPIKELRKKISEAYPFGERAMFPYKVWLEEVKKVLRRKIAPTMAPKTMDGKQTTIFKE